MFPNKNEQFSIILLTLDSNTDYNKSHRFTWAFSLEVNVFFSIANKIKMNEGVCKL